MTDPYVDREQTKAKHLILRRYLQALAFKVLTFQDITYVDGFSGPWETKTEDFADTSFKIAITVLQDAQQRIFDRGKVRRTIRCFLSERDVEAFGRLEQAVAPFNDPANKFEIKTYCGEFENAVGEIQKFIGSSFPLIFIDPTGWTGYPFEKIRPLFARAKCEVLINFMYEFINRFVYFNDESNLASLDPILGGPGWMQRLDPSLPRGMAVERLFRETLKLAGNFDYVISARIDKATADRPHFFITYATKSDDGLKTFRQTEYDALREHERNRAKAIDRKREEKSGISDLFADHRANTAEATLDVIIAQQKTLAGSKLLALLRQNGSSRFSEVVAMLLQSFMLREMNIKDICVELANSGTIENTWGGGRNKPKSESFIRLKERK